MNIVCNKWTFRFLEMSKLVASWSKDPSTQCGSVIVRGEDNTVLGLGYNGFPRGVYDSAERYGNREVKYKLVVHAEANAILNARGSVLGATLYTTKFPCSECAKLIIQAGIKEIVCRVDDSPSAQRWGADRDFSRTMFAESGVTVTEVP